MSKYIGTPVVSLSTDTVDVTGDITTTDATPEVIIVNDTHEDTDGGREGKLTFKGQQSGGEETTLAEIQGSHDGTSDDEKGDLIFKTNDGSDGASPTEAMRITSDQRLGIGTNDPSAPLQVQGSAGEIRLQRPTASQADWSFKLPTSGGELTFYDNNNSSEAMRIDSSGNLLVGKTVAGDTGAGVTIQEVGKISAVRDGGISARFVRETSDGDIVEFLKDGTTVGSISCNNSRVAIHSVNAGLHIASSILPSNGSGARTDNTYDIGNGSFRWDDIFATNGTIQTSDRNEKQDIEDLSEAELRVATAAKGLIKKYRWIDAVEEKGDNARIHVGIIAQDLQAAFEAEGLDAGRYAMFISDTWWEADRVVPAVEANEEEGIEAVAEHTVTDTFDTEEEAPEGATERTRLGVRYPELLAFIIGAM